MKKHARMNRFRFALLVSSFLFCASSAFSQQYDPGIMGTVNALFDGMRSGDSTKVRNAFALGATMMSVPENPKDSIAVKKNLINGFVKAVGTPHPEKWDEQIFHPKISVDGPMAIVWAPYKFFLGDKFSHCGVNVFTLIKLSSGWKITSVTDTRRKECSFDN
ncbi:nuclear transport factor 2 family protein [Dyadobacter sp. CY107]|uniref:nuclear transport factor 2 family protein n=1 Tax=Dyadobacter fanqingshengii TaxID=2906443 RepID=UPI001F3D5F12|nr:nuclear transport factor 2 family protein [Dyadobacter fanqingshengii]MCF2506486.1 nuclear transport factor 2 family protein [Dyadobacter fanqingshengii]